MIKFILKRLIALIPVVIGATFIVFMLMNIAGGDPARILLGSEASQEAVDEMREAMGLNDPVITQYVRYLVNLTKGDMGESYKSGEPVIKKIGEYFPNTVKVSVTAIAISVLLALPLGIIAAIKQNTIYDWISMVVSLLGLSMPAFWLGLLLILAFALGLGWFPVSGSEGWRSLVLPSLTLAIQGMAVIARTTRSSMLEVIGQDYIRTARAKGLPYKTVIQRHGLRNALVPTVTAVGLQMGHLLGGSVLVETVFGWPGLGRLMIQSIQSRDIPVVLGCILVFAASVSVVNLLVDIVYAIVDPRMKSQF